MGLCLSTIGNVINGTHGLISNQNFNFCRLSEGFFMAGGGALVEGGVTQI